VAKGNYIISAYAWPVPGETDLTDNTLVDGYVTVAMIGDINGPAPNVPDGQVDIRDVALVAIAFDAKIQEDIPNYREYWHSTPCSMCPHNPNCDVTSSKIGVAEGIIDIRDVATVAIRFGQIDP